MDDSGKLVMESILETKASTLLQFLAGLRGNLSVTFEEGTWAAWLYDVLKPHVTHLVVCNPRKNALLKAGSKSDRIDTRKLAELLRGNHLKPVSHGETGGRMLREVGGGYVTIVEDQSRVMSQLKALYRSWGLEYILQLPIQGMLDSLPANLPFRARPPLVALRMRHALHWRTRRGCLVGILQA